MTDARAINRQINFAIQLKEAGRINDAIAALEPLVDAGADNPDLLLCLGALCLDSGRAAPALDYFERVIGLAPWSANAWYNRANALRHLRRFDEAGVSYRKCLRIEPGHAEACINLGVLLQALKDYPSALACYDRALQIRPESVSALYNRALVLEHTGELALAITGYQYLLEKFPGYPYLRGRAHHARMRLCDWSLYSQSAAQLCDLVSQGLPVSVPFSMLAVTDDASLQRRCAKTYTQDKFPPSDAFSLECLNTNRRIRVGYFSSDLRTHAVGFLTAELFEGHCRDEFEVFAFSLGAAPEGDAYRDRIASACEHFIDASQMTDTAVIDMARSLGLDIAVDLAGHTMDARTTIFAQRVAPIQINYLGYPGSMAAAYMDVILADDTVIPKGAESGYTERVFRLPHTFQVNDSQRKIGLVQTRTHYGLPEEGLVFASFNTSYKLNPVLFDIWCRVLISAPGGVLWLLGESEQQKENLVREAGARGISAGRLIFAERTSYEAHLARYAHVDLVLDTFPFNGGTSTSDALWGGAPVLTCMGQAFASRMSASLLRAANLQSLVTDSLPDYEAMALALATDPKRLSVFKSHLQNRTDSSPLFDTAARIKAIEDAYRALILRHATPQ